LPTRQAEPCGAARASSSGPATGRRPVVASKPAPPPLRPAIVDRPELLNGLVSAPAGYGRTTRPAVSFYRRGDLLRAVDTLNGVTP
jgi:hypothetical protein